MRKCFLKEQPAQGSRHKDKHNAWASQTPLEAQNSPRRAHEVSHLGQTAHSGGTELIPCKHTQRCGTELYDRLHEIVSPDHFYITATNKNASAQPEKTPDLTWTPIKIRFTALFLMLYSTQDIVTTLQNLQDHLRSPYNSDSVHERHVAEALNELNARTNEINDTTCLCLLSSVVASTTEIILSKMSPACRRKKRC